MSLRTISFSLSDGWSLGGVTNWTLNLAEEFFRSGWKVNLLVHHDHSRNPLPCPDGVRVIKVGGYSAWHPRYSYMADYVQAYKSVLPSVFVPSSSSGTYAACAELAKTQARDMRVIGFLHSDWPGCYEWMVYYQSLLSAQVCVSTTIKAKLLKQLPKRRAGVYVRHYPVKRVHGLDRAYSESDDPLKIVYAGRLCEEQKRFSDVLRIAKILSERKVGFRLDVYGRGTEEEEKRYRQMVNDWLVDEIGSVVIHPPVSQDRILKIWEMADICLMTSAYEGASISLIEACSRGAVPVVTDVSGVRDLVGPEEGVVCETGDVEGLAEGIVRLFYDREMLQAMGDAVRRRVTQICNMNDYVQWFSSVCEQSWESPDPVWSRRKKTICVTHDMASRGFDPRPPTITSRLVRKLRKSF